ncbi:hypothetical protein ACSS6W_002848 [Trichoderma asperelloides]
MQALAGGYPRPPSSLCLYRSSSWSRVAARRSSFLVWLSVTDLMRHLNFYGLIRLATGQAVPGIWDEARGLNIAYVMAQS